LGVDWEDRIDLDRLRTDRIEAVRRALRASDLDALLLWKDENVRYLTSLRAQLIAGKTTSPNGS
jgi:Xaa-Pro dipeptidase